MSVIVYLCYDNDVCLCIYFKVQFQVRVSISRLLFKGIKNQNYFLVFIKFIR